METAEKLNTETAKELNTDKKEIHYDLRWSPTAGEWIAIPVSNFNIFRDWESTLRIHSANYYDSLWCPNPSSCPNPCFSHPPRDWENISSDEKQKIIQMAEENVKEFIEKQIPLFTEKPPTELTDLNNIPIEQNQH